MKIALTIFCSLLLLWAQAAVASVPAAGPAAHDCCHSCKMACCKAAPAPHSIPLNATTVATSQQIVSPVPATVILVLSTAEPASIAPTVSHSLSAAGAPLFARFCVRLI